MSDQLPAVAQEIATIEQGMRADPAAYWRSPETQDRYRSLIDARDNGGTVPAQRGGKAQEIAEIERTMRTDPRRYFRDQALQERYRTLLAERDGVRDEIVPQAGRWLVQPDTWLASLPAGVADTWRGQHGGAEQGLARLQGAVVAILSGLEDEAAGQSFLTTFRALPEHARAAVLQEAGRPESGFVKPATDGEMDAFRLLHGGAETIAAWGRNARRNVAVALEKFNRAHERMSASDRSAFGRWLRTIPPRQQQLFLWTLGN